MDKPSNSAAVKRDFSMIAFSKVNKLEKQFKQLVEDVEEIKKQLREGSLQPAQEK